VGEFRTNIAAIAGSCDCVIVCVCVFSWDLGENSGMPYHLSVTVNPVPSRGYPGKISPLPHGGASASRFPAISLESRVFGDHGT
jgi:hypothetical protein